MMYMDSPKYYNNALPKNNWTIQFIKNTEKNAVMLNGCSIVKAWMHHKLNASSIV